MCVPPEEGVRVFQTIGTTGIPVKVMLNKKDWTVHFHEQFMHFMNSYGIGTSDILYVPFGYGLYIAWWGFQAALEQAGVMIVPGANVKSTKKVIEYIWGARFYDDIGSSEISNFGFECIFQKGTHVNENMFYAECLDPDTLEPVDDGQVGELVLSNLCTETMPLIRYRKCYSEH